MNDETKTQAELIAELQQMRARVAELEEQLQGQGEQHPTAHARMMALELQVTTTLIQHSDLLTMLQKCTQLIAQQFETLRVGIWTMNEATNMLELQAKVGLGWLGDRLKSLSMGQSIVGQIAVKQQPYTTNELSQDEQVNWFSPPGSPLTAFAGYPLLIDNQLVGVLIALSAEPFDRLNYTTLASVANEIAIGIGRKQTEEALRSSQGELQDKLHLIQTHRKEQQRLIYLIENSSDFIGLATLDGQMLHLNLAGQKMVGLDVHVTETMLMDYFDKRTSHMYQTQIIPKAMQGEVWRGEASLKHLKTGELIFVEMALFAVPDLETGEPSCFATMQRDVTERKQIEDELEQYRYHLEKLVVDRTYRLEIAAALSRKLNAILDVDELLDTIVNMVKESFDYYHAHIYLIDDNGEELIMAAGAEPAGKPLKAQNHRIPVRVKSLVSRSYRSRSLVMVNDVYEASDWLSNPLLPDTRSEIAVPIFDEMEVVGVLDVQSDEVNGFDESDANLLRSLVGQVGVAMRNARLYSMMQQTNQELERLNANKDKFFSIVAHDLKAPFMPLLGNLEILIEMAEILPPAEVKSLSLSVQRSARGAYNLLENLLEWARIQMGRLTYQPKDLDLHEIAAKNVELLNQNAAEKQIALQNQVSVTSYIYADAYMVDTVIRNLMSNALKFTPEAGEIIVKAAPNTEDGDDTESPASMLRVSVADSGVGMRQEDIDKLFKLDEHHSTVGTAKETGTGLGLLLCKEMVEKNGGEIWVSSELGEGTTVGFTVPVGQAVQAAEAPDAASEKGKQPTTVQRATVNERKPAQQASSTEPVNPSEIIKMSESVNRSAKAIYDLLDELLHWVHHQLNWLIYKPVPVDLERIVNSNLKFLSETAALDHITIRSELPVTTPALADWDILNIVIRGLILNALKFTPNGGEVIVSAVRGIDGQYIEMAVTDTGSGMEKKELDRLITAHAGGLSVTKRPLQTTDVNLGLIIYKELVQMNRGQIWVESEPDKGTTVKFTVPTYVE